jgi:predicted acyltransferase
MPAFTMAGVIVSSLYSEATEKNKLRSFWLVLLLFGIGMLVIGFLLRPYGGISKIRATPAWVGICSGINILVFVLLMWLVDVKKKQNWFAIIMPAGTSTLTCYLIPYLLYSVYELVHFHYPAFLNEGIGGLFRSLLVAFLVVLFTGWLQKRRLCIRI